jgi:hypothetical protein
VSSDQFGLAVELERRDAESCVLTLAGELSLRSAGTVCGAVTKALLEVDRVLIDVSRLRLTWTPAAQVFPSTLAVMGGWPWARLVLFGADAVLATSLNELGLTTAVPLAADEPEARQLVERRPPTVSRYLEIGLGTLTTRRSRRLRSGREQRVRRHGGGADEPPGHRPSVVTVNGGNRPPDRHPG